MKKIIILSAVLSFIIVASVKAQKLPNIQEKSLRAPAAIKVDGKPTEWNDQFQAYNKATDIFYTISNDNDKLYLTVKVPNLDIINKIVSAGITLTINGTGKMKDQDGMSVTYPYLNIDRLTWGANPRGSYTPTFPPIPSINMVMENSANSKGRIDSFMVIFNQDLSSKAKDIKIEGIKEIKDPLISIYNPQGIKVAALVDNNTDLTYELAIPLKSLGLSINSPKPFFYNIKLTGFNPDPEGHGNKFGPVYKTFREELKKTIWGDVAYVLKGPYGPLVTTLIWPTDFWGEYTLAK